MKSGIRVGLILGVSFIISAVIFGSYFYRAQNPGQTITVVGAASQNFEADTVKWTLNIEEDISGDNLSAGYEKLKTVREKIFALLATKGMGRFYHDETPQVYKEYDYTSRRGSSGVTIPTDDLCHYRPGGYGGKDGLESLELLNGGRSTQIWSIFIPALMNLKRNWWGSNENAQTGRKDGGTDHVKVGKIVSVRSGVFQITEPIPPGRSRRIHDTSTRHQQILGHGPCDVCLK